jgi:hypothetical protein
MTPSRLWATLLVLPLLAGEARAQNIFELLFGPPRRVAPPPAPVPYGGRPPPLPSEEISPPVVRAPTAPPQARPLLINAPLDSSVFDRDLKQNGNGGSLRIERVPSGGLRTRITLAGTRISNPAEACSLQLSAAGPLPLVSDGRPENVSRFHVEGAACPISFDVLEGAVLVDPKTEACEVKESDCRVEAGGMWGPDAATLIPQARTYEQQRGSADKAVRENYKALAQRAPPGGVRPIVAEQAAFSSDREQVCRNYAREGSHSFCNARFTEARALALAGKLGMTSVAGNEERTSSTRRRRSPIAELPEDQPQ